MIGLKRSTITRRNRIIFIVLGSLFLLGVAALLSLQLPAVQTGIAAYVTDKLKGKFDGDIRFSGIKILPLSAVVLDDVLLTDDHPAAPESDTLFFAKKLSANIYLGSLLRKGLLRIGRVAVDGAYLHFVYEGDSTYGNNLMRVLRIPLAPEAPPDTSDIFAIRRVRLDNFRFRFTNALAEEPFTGPDWVIDWNDFDIHADIRGHALKFRKGRMGGIADHVSLSEKSGFHCRHIAGTAIAGMGQAMITDLTVEEDNSEIHLKELSFTYANGSAFENFIDEVRIGGRFNRTRLALKTLRFFTGSFENNRIVADISSGTVDGPVRDLNISGLAFRDTVSRLSARFDGRIRGLPDLDDVSTRTNISDLRFTSSGLRNFISNFAPDAVPPLERFLPETWYIANSHTEGHIRNFREEISILSGIGDIRLNSSLANIGTDKPISINSHLHSSGVDIGRIIRSDAAGKCSADLNILLETDGEELQASLDTGLVHSIVLLGHEFRNISAEGVVDGHNFRAGIRTDDPACRLALNSSCVYDEERERSVYRIGGTVEDADLHAFGIDFHKGEARTAFRTQGEMIMEAGHRNRARMTLSDLSFKDSTGVHSIGNVLAEYLSYGQENRMMLDSDFLKAEWQSDLPLDAVIADLESRTLGIGIPALLDSDEQKGEAERRGRYELNAKTANTRALLDFLLPTMYIERGTTASISCDEDGRFSADFNSGRLIAGNIRTKSLRLNADNKKGSLNARFDGDELNIGKVHLQGCKLNATATEGIFGLDLSYDGIEKLDSKGSVHICGSVENTGDGLLLTARPSDSRIFLNDQLWRLGESEIRAGNGRVAFKDFSIDCNQQHIRLDGGISSTLPDTLRLFVQNFDLETADIITNGVYGLNGTISADARYISPTGDGSTKLSFGLLCEELSLNNVIAGTVIADCNWNEKLNRLDYSLQNTMEHRQTIDAQGYLRPSDGKLSASMELDEFNVGVLGPFLKDFFSEMGGSMSGKLKAGGTLKRISLSSKDAQFDSTLLRIAYTGVPYIFDGPFRIDDKGIICDNVRISDFEGQKATLDGGLRYDHFQNPSLDATLSFRDMTVIDSNSDGFRELYGKLFASGNARVTGPLDNLSVEAEARTTREGNVTLGSSGGASTRETNGLLTFAVKEETDEELLVFERRLKEEEERSNKSNINIKGHLLVNPAVTMNMQIDAGSGSGISANGRGDINIELNTSSGDMSLLGNYNISSGKFLYEMPGILKKEFILQEDSKVSFGGDLMNSDLDVNAIYKLSTSLSTLIADSTSTNIRRHVNCGIHISDKIRQPKISFSIDVPDLDPTTKSQVQSALNTEDKVQKQFVALLLFGTFIPTEQSGVVNGSNILYSNLSEVMMSQVNNVLQKLGIPLDFGFGYQQNNSGNDVFDLAVSTQLFNNRVIVNGSVGNRKYKTSSNPGGDFVGDLDIEVKIDKPGRYRVKLFSHSADEYASYLDYSQRNGIGFTYQQEFNDIRQFFKNIFTSRKKREKRKAVPEREPIVIEVKE